MSRSSPDCQGSAFTLHRQQQHLTAQTATETDSCHFQHLDLLGLSLGDQKSPCLHPGGIQGRLEAGKRQNRETL